jgi:hypothetical protein
LQSICQAQKTEDAREKQLNYEANIWSCLMDKDNIEFITFKGKKYPKVLYHYTSIDKFKHIVESKVLHLTSIQFVNDSLEYFQCKKIIRESYLRKYKENGSSNLTPYFLSLNDFLDCNLLENENIFEVNTFIASFSEDCDSLSQWRAYCPTGGCALGFRTEELLNKWDIDTSKSSDIFDQCKYLKKDQDPFLKPFFENVFDSNILKDGSNVSKEDWFVVTVTNLYKYAPFIKHHSFKDEKEWRFSSGNTLNKFTRKFRLQSSKFVPYIEKELPCDDCNGKKKLVLEHIYCGPGIDIGNIKLYTEDNISFKDNIHIYPSDSPYQLN